MKDYSQDIEKELVGDWSTHKPLPDGLYFRKVIKRNVLLIVAGLGLTGLGVWSAPQWAKNTYESKVHAVFDQSGSTATQDLSVQTRTSALARLFQARFESQEFIDGVRASLPPEDIQALEASQKLLPWGKAPASEDSKLDRTLMKSFETSAETETGVLTLKAQARSPELAQKLANAAMESFIARELDDQIRGLEVKLEVLKSNVNPNASTPKAAPNRSRTADRLSSEDKEREFDERLRGLNAQVDQVRRERDQALTGIKRDLVRLQTSLQSNHPQVVEKRKELDLVSSQYRQSENKILAEANQIRSQLRSLRVTQSKTMDVADIDVSAARDYEGSFFTSLSDRIKEAELEKQNLVQQKSDPSKRTRLSTLYPASYEPLPAQNNSRMAQYAFAFSGLLLTMLLVAFREWQTPLARDAWLIERLTSKRIISQISHKNTHEYTNITPALADQLRTHLARTSRIDEAARTLLSYRRLELAIMQECKGDTVLLINAGSSDMSAQVIKNFLNIYATDHQDDYLLIDCNMQEPIFQHKDPSIASSLVDYLDDKVKFEDVCVNREQMADFSFDVIPPMMKFAGTHTRIFRADKVQTAIERIPFKYKKIFVRGMPAAHFIENRALLTAATDVIIFIDARRTHYFDLQRTLVHLESDKIRGLVAIGT